MLIAQVQTAQHQILGVGVIAYMMKRTKYARKVIFRFLEKLVSKDHIKLFEAFYSFAIYFILDVYVKLEGKWDVEYGSNKYHATLMMAKRYCSKTANCFGIREFPNGYKHSIEYPIELRQRQQGLYYIHKKEHIAGNFH